MFRKSNFYDVKKASSILHHPSRGSGKASYASQMELGCSAGFTMAQVAQLRQAYF